MRRPNRGFRRRMAAGLAAAVATAAAGDLTGPVSDAAGADDVDCTQVSCVALTFDDGPSPHTDRLLRLLADNDAKATFFLIGNKVAGDYGAAGRIADAGMEIGNHTFDHPDMTTIAPREMFDQLAGANDAIGDATGMAPTLWRPPGGQTNPDVDRRAGELGLATLLWDVVAYDWINDADTAATRKVLLAQTRPGSVVLLHDTFASTVELMGEFLPMLKANGYHPVTVSQLLGPRAPGSVYGSRDNGAPANDLRDLAIRDG